MARERPVREWRDLSVAGGLEQSERLGLLIARREPHTPVTQRSCVLFELSEQRAPDSQAAHRLVEKDPPDLPGLSVEALQAPAADRRAVQIGDEPSAIRGSEILSLEALGAPGAASSDSEM